MISKRRLSVFLFLMGANAFIMCPLSSNPSAVMRVQRWSQHVCLSSLWCSLHAQQHAVDWINHYILFYYFFFFYKSQLISTLAGWNQTAEFIFRMQMSARVMAKEALVQINKSKTIYSAWSQICLPDHMESYKMFRLGQGSFAWQYGKPLKKNNNKEEGWSLST